MLPIHPAAAHSPPACPPAELATTFPENSGYVAWVTAAFGPFWGFQVRGGAHGGAPGGRRRVACAAAPRLPPLLLRRPPAARFLARPPRLLAPPATNQPDHTTKKAEGLLRLGVGRHRQRRLPGAVPEVLEGGWADCLEWGWCRVGAQWRVGRQRCLPGPAPQVPEGGSVLTPWRVAGWQRAVRGGRARRVGGTAAARRLPRSSPARAPALLLPRAGGVPRVHRRLAAHVRAGALGG